jgi:hypothetical protein
MRSTVIHQRNGWALTSYGNGWAYSLALTENEKTKSVWFQDDDANEFRARVMDDEGWLLDDAEERFADYSEVMRED